MKTWSTTTAEDLNLGPYVPGRSRQHWRHEANWDVGSLTSAGSDPIKDVMPVMMTEVCLVSLQPITWMYYILTQVHFIYQNNLKGKPDMIGTVNIHKILSNHTYSF